MSVAPALLRTPNWSLSNKDRAGIRSARRPCPGREDLSRTPRRLQIVLAKKRSGPLRSEPRHFSDPASKPCPTACPTRHGRRVPALFAPRRHRFPRPPPACPSSDTNRRAEFGYAGCPVPPAATFSAGRPLRRICSCYQPCVNLDRAACNFIEQLLGARASETFSSILMRPGRPMYKYRRAVELRTGTTQTSTSAPPRVGRTPLLYATGGERGSQRTSAEL